MSDSLVDSHKKNTVEHLQSERRWALEYAAQMEKAIASLLGKADLSPLDIYPYLNMAPSNATIKFLTRMGTPQTLKDITEALVAGGVAYGKRQGEAQIGKAIDRCTYVSKPPKFWIVGDLVGLAKWPKPKK